MRNRIVQPIDGRAIGSGDQMTVGVDSDLNRRMPELLFDVDDGLALLQ